MDLQKLTLQVCSLAEETAVMIREAVLKMDDIEEKSSNNFVTWVDKTSETHLVKGLERLLPGSGFIGEEDTMGNHRAHYTWIIDPLDGTTNFIHAVPLFCISIALVEENTIVSGVILEINSSECFYAWRGGGAFLNGRKIKVSGTPAVKDSLIATGFPYYDYGRLEEYMTLFEYMMQHSHGLRRLGSAAADMAWVACGRFDAFYEYGLSPWDVAAGSLLVEEAGGKVCDFSGGEDYLFGKELIASNSAIFMEMKAIVGDYFSDIK